LKVPKINNFNQYISYELKPNQVQILLTQRINHLQNTRRTIKEIGWRSLPTTNRFTKN